MRSKDPTRPRKVIEGVTEDMGAINELVTEMIENANPLLYRMLTYYSANKPKYASKRVTYRAIKGSRRAPAIPESDPTYKPDNSKGIVKIANQGSSRSGKTWTVAQFIFLWCYWNYNKANTSGRYIAVWRDTAVDCSKNTYKDFEECFKYLGVWDICSVTTAPRPKIRLFGNTIEFMGLPEPGKQAPRTDISFFNEVVETADPHRVAGIVMRCQYAAIYDWNPSYTSHWVFGLEDEMNEGKNVLFTRTSYLDNPNLPEAVVMNIEALCPWKYDDPEECEVYLDDQGFKKRRWLKPERPEGCPLSEYHLYRADNLVNIQAGTADRWRWLVYGEGIPAAKEGAVFDPGWIDAFPENLDMVNLSLDFGYSADPSVLVRSGCNRREKTLYSECLMYHPTPDSDSLFEAIEMPLWEEVRRQLAEAMPFDWMYQWEDLLLNESRTKLLAFTKTAAIKPKILVACDSKDTYKDEEFVLQLNSISSQKGYRWQFVKVQKPRVVVRIALMKRFRHLIVKNKNVELEAQNYVYEIVDGQPTNNPVDKFNHFWDALGYAVIYFYKWLLV